MDRPNLGHQKIHQKSGGCCFCDVSSSAGHALTGKDSMTSKPLPPVTNKIPGGWQQSNSYCVHGPNQENPIPYQHRCCVSNTFNACQ